MSGMSDYVYVARDMVMKILISAERPTEDGIYELLQIQTGSKEVLLEHLKAIHNIFGKAIEELEGGENENNRFIK